MMFICPITGNYCTDQECDIEGCREAATWACAVCVHCGAVHISVSETASCDVCGGVQLMGSNRVSSEAIFGAA